jgi:ABC-type transport system involved in multi-copper enzyme maturation permease subunit
VIGGLLLKTLREVRVTALILAGAMMFAMALLTLVLPQVMGQMNEILLQMPIIKVMFSTLLGMDAADNLTIQMLRTFIWVHPVVLAMTWGFAIAFCTHLPAGEIDRGTIDVLLSWPVSRRGAYLCATIVWLAAGVAILIMGLLGHLISARTMSPEMRSAARPLILIVLNLYLTYVAVGGVTCLISSLSNRRGRAVAVAVSFVVASFLLNFLAQFWEPAAHISFLSVSSYYQPARILLEQRIAPGDAIVLIGIGLGAWILGGEIFARRNICTA